MFLTNDTVGNVGHGMIGSVDVTAHEKQVGGEHYVSLPIQPIVYIRKNNLGWYEGNIVKYVTRHKQKGQRQDILKVIHYAELLLEEYDDERSDNVATSDGHSDGIGPLFEQRTEEDSGATDT